MEESRAHFIDHYRFWRYNARVTEKEAIQQALLFTGQDYPWQGNHDVRIIQQQGYFWRYLFCAWGALLGIIALVTGYVMVVMAVPWWIYFALFFPTVGLVIILFLMAIDMVDWAAMGWERVM